TELSGRSLRIADEINADSRTRCVLDRLIAADIGRPKNGRLAEYASPALIDSRGAPVRIVPSPRPLPIRVDTFVATRMKSSPLFPKRHAAIPCPPSSATASPTEKFLFILVEPKYRAGASLPPTTSSPSILGAPNFAVWSLKAAIAFATLAS